MRRASAVDAWATRKQQDISGMVQPQGYLLSGSPAGMAHHAAATPHHALGHPQGGLLGGQSVAPPQPLMAHAPTQGGGLNRNVSPSRLRDASFPAALPQSPGAAGGPDNLQNMSDLGMLHARLDAIESLALSSKGGDEVAQLRLHVLRMEKELAAAVACAEDTAAQLFKFKGDIILEVKDLLNEQRAVHQIEKEAITQQFELQMAAWKEEVLTSAMVQQRAMSPAPAVSVAPPPPVADTPAAAAPVIAAVPEKDEAAVKREQRLLEDKIRSIVAEDVQTLKAGLPQMIANHVEAEVVGVRTAASRLVEERLEDEFARIQKTTTRMIDTRVEDELSKANAATNRTIENKVEQEVQRAHAQASRVLASQIEQQVEGQLEAHVAKTSRLMGEQLDAHAARTSRVINDQIDAQAAKTSRLVTDQVEANMAKTSRFVNDHLEAFKTSAVVHEVPPSAVTHDPNASLEQVKDLIKDSEELLKDEIVTNFLPNKLETIVRNHMNGLQSQLTAQVHSQLQSQLPTQVRSTLQATLPQHIQSHIDATLPKQVKSQVYSQVQSQMSTIPAPDPAASQAAQEAELQNLLQKELSSQLPALVQSQVFEVLQQQLPTYQEQQMDTIHADVDRHLREVMPNHLANQVRTYLQANLGNQVGQQLRTLLPNSVQTQLQNQLPSQMRGLLQNQLGSQIKSQVNAELSQTMQRVADVEASVHNYRTESQRQNPGEELKAQVSQMEERLKGVEMTSMWPAPPPPSHLPDQERLNELSKKVEDLEHNQQQQSMFEQPVSGASVVDENLRNEVGDLQSRLSIMEAGPSVADIERKINRRIDDVLDQKSRAGALTSKLENMEANAQMSAMKRRLDTVEQHASRLGDVLQQSKQLSARVDSLEHTPFLEDMKRRLDELADMRGTVLSLAGRMDSVEETTAVHRLDKEIARHVQDACHPLGLKVETIERAVGEIDRRLTARLDHAQGGLTTQGLTARLDSLDANLANTYQMQKKVEELERRSLKADVLDAEFDSRIAPRLKKVEEMFNHRLSQVEDMAQSHAPKVSLFESQFPRISANEDAMQQRLSRLEQHMSETLPAITRAEEGVDKRVSQLETRALKRLEEIEEVVPQVRHLLNSQAMAKDSESRLARRMSDLEELGPMVRQLTASQVAQKDPVKIADELVKVRVRELEADLASRVDQMESQILPKIRNAEAALNSRMVGQDERMNNRVSALEDHVARSNPFESQMLSKAVDDVVPKVHTLEATLSQIERQMPQREKVQQMDQRLRELEDQTSRLASVDDMRQKHVSQIEKERDGDRDRLSRVEGIEAKFGPLLTTLEQQVLPWVASVEEHVIPRIKALEDHALDSRMRAVEEDLLPRVKEIEEHFPALLKLLPRVKSMEKTTSQLNSQVASQVSNRDGDMRSVIADMGIDRKMKLVEDAIFPLVKVVENQLIPRMSAVEQSIPDVEGAVSRTQELGNAIQRLQQGLVTVASQQEKTKEDCGLVCSALRDEITSLKKKQQALVQQQAQAQAAQAERAQREAQYQQQQQMMPDTPQGGFASQQQYNNSGRISPLRPRNN